jgi:hypothetical protein
MDSMHTMDIVYNNFYWLLYNMKQKQIQKIIMPVLADEQGKSSGLFFPRIIREFDDGPDEKPMLYGGE